MSPHPRRVGAGVRSGARTYTPRPGFPPTETTSPGLVSKGHRAPSPAMTQHQSGPGMVPLRPFVTACLDEDEAAGRDPAVIAAHRRLLAAYNTNPEC